MKILKAIVTFALMWASTLTQAVPFTLSWDGIEASGTAFANNTDAQYSYNLFRGIGRIEHIELGNHILWDWDDQINEYNIIFYQYYTIHADFNNDNDVYRSGTVNMFVYRNSPGTFSATGNYYRDTASIRNGSFIGWLSSSGHSHKSISILSNDGVDTAIHSQADMDFIVGPGDEIFDDLDELDFDVYVEKNDDGYQFKSSHPVPSPSPLPLLILGLAVLGLHQIYRR